MIEIVLAGFSFSEQKSQSQFFYQTKLLTVVLMEPAWKFLPRVRDQVTDEVAAKQEHG